MPEALDHTIRWFSEYLPRLNSVSVCLELAASEIRAVVLANGREFHVENAHGEAVDIKLPRECEGSGDLSRLLVQDKDTSVLRLRCAAEQTDAQKTIDSLTNTDSLKWSVEDLETCSKQGGSLECSSCSSVLIDLGHVTRINAMPSEIWSEMMEYWHCHKPATGNYTNESIMNRFSSFRPAKNGLIVGSYYLIVNPEDFSGFAKMDNEALGCGNCGTKVADLDKINNNYKIYKWGIQLRRKDAPKIDRFRPCLFVYMSLLESVSSTAVRFFLVKSSPQRQILVWCFGFGLAVTLTNHTSALDDALKLLYIDDAAEIESFVSENDGEGTNGRSLHNKYEILEVDELVQEDLELQLAELNGLLPAPHQRLNQWKLSYLSKSI